MHYRIYIIQVSSGYSELLYKSYNYSSALFYFKRVINDYDGTNFEPMLLACKHWIKGCGFVKYIYYGFVRIFTALKRLIKGGK